MEHQPPVKLARLRPRHSLCEFEPYQCDRPRYLRSRFCDAHICEMQTLRSLAANSHAGSSQGELTVDVSPPAMPPGSALESSPPAASTAQAPPPPSPVIQCQYRVRRYERRCRNPVPPDGGDVHFCSEHRARVASRRDTNGPNAAPGASAATSGPSVGSGSSGVAGATGGGEGAAVAAVIGDYAGLAERWTGRRATTGGKERPVEAHYGHEGLPMPRGKEERGEWREDWDSDAESPASDDEDMLETTKNAGSYSLHELLINAMFHRRKLMLLYQEQMAYLRRILQHDYAVYEEVRRDHRQMRTATNTIIMRGRQAQSFRATRKFKRYSGAESLLHDKSKRVRLRSVCPEKIKPSANPQRCAYNDPTKDEKCPERVLPLCKYCPKHILHQANQCLFEPCRAERCEHPVLRSAIADERDDSAATGGAPAACPEQFCAAHRPEETLLDFLPSDASKSLLVDALNALSAPPEPPPEAMAAAREEAAAQAASSASASPDKARSLRREDSMTLHEPFDFNLLIPDVMDMAEMDTNLMEEALSVLRDPEHAGGAPGGSMQAGLVPGAGGAVVGTNWEDITNLDLYPLLPGDLEPLNEAWQRLINSGSPTEERRTKPDGLEDLPDLDERPHGDEESAVAVAGDEPVEVEVVGEELDLMPGVDPQQEQLHLQELRNLQAEMMPGVVVTADGEHKETVMYEAAMMHNLAPALLEEAYDGASPPLQSTTPNLASLKTLEEVKSEPAALQQAPEACGDEQTGQSSAE